MRFHPHAWEHVIRKARRRTKAHRAGRTHTPTSLIAHGDPADPVLPPAADTGYHAAAATAPRPGRLRPASKWASSLRKSMNVNAEGDLVSDCTNRSDPG